MNKKHIALLVAVIVVIVALIVFFVMKMNSSNDGLPPGSDQTASSTTATSTSGQTPGKGTGAAPASPTATDPQGVRGSYVGFIFAQASAGTVTLHLNSDAGKTAVLTEDHLNGDPAVASTGTWKQGDEDSVTVSLTKEPRGGIDTVLSFRIEGNSLVLEQKDTKRWGAAGLTVYRSALSLNSSWAWSANSAFVMSLTPDAKVSVKGDCNLLSGSYSIQDKNNIGFFVTATTKKACAGSKEQDFLNTLGNVVSYEVSNNTLMLTLRDQSKMLFTRK
jgi:hypothetical protein